MKRLEGSSGGVPAWASAVVAVVPFAFVVLAGWLAWDSALHWKDLAILAVMYVPIGLGVTVGSTACSRIAASQRVP